MSKTGIQYFKLYVCIAIVCIQSSIGNARPIVTINNVSVDQFPCIVISGKVTLPSKAKSISISTDNFIVKEDGFVVSNADISIEAVQENIVGICINTSKYVPKKEFINLKKVVTELLKSAPPSYTFYVFSCNENPVLLHSESASRDTILKKVQNLKQNVTENKIQECIKAACKTVAPRGKNASLIVVTWDKDGENIVKANEMIRNVPGCDLSVYFVISRKCKQSSPLMQLSKTSKHKLLIVHPEVHLQLLHELESLYGPMEANFTVQFTTKKRDAAAHAIEIQFILNDIRDNDVQYIQYIAPTAHNKLVDMPLLVLSGIAVLLIVALIVVVIVFVNKWKLIIEMINMRRIPQPIEKKFTEIYAKDFALRKQETPLIFSSSPDYAYAHAWLVEKSGPETGKKFPLIWDEVTIGRDKENTIVIDDDAVSLKHAKIKRIGDCYYLFDCASDNGTYLNDKKLLRPKPLSDWDEIKIGRTIILFRGSKIRSEI